jgi:hypothetical protein
MKKKIVIVLLVLFIGIQFIRAEENSGPADTAQDIAHFVGVPGPVMEVLRSSCYDCHSNHTHYPWYAKVNPVGMWLNHHIEEGKAEINFSDFSKYDVKRLDHKLEEIAEEAQEGHMPLPAYTFLHTDAQLTEAQIRLLVDWVKTERQKLNVPGKESQ